MWSNVVWLSARSPCGPQKWTDVRGPACASSSAAVRTFFGRVLVVSFGEKVSEGEDGERGSGECGDRPSVVSVDESADC